MMSLIVRLSIEQQDKVETIVCQTLSQITKREITGKKMTLFILGKKLGERAGHRSIQTSQNSMDQKMFELLHHLQQK